MLNKKNIFASCLNFLKPTKGKLGIFFILLILSIIVFLGGIDPDYHQGTFQMSALLKILILIFLWPGIVGPLANSDVSEFNVLVINILYLYILSCIIYFFYAWLKSKLKTN